MPDRVGKIFSEIADEILDIRHHIHSRPELQYEEKDTCSFIRDVLADEGLTILPPFLGTDTVCILEGKLPGPTVLLRADIDALSMPDEGGKPWASRTEGVHHGCGHDGHTAMLIGAARILVRIRDSLRGRVVFVFQPAEEGGGGGEKLLEAGLFEKTGRPDGAFALHGWPGLPEGVLHTRPGPLMAAQDRFFIDITGTGSHSAMPHLSRDPVLSAASLIVELQSLVSREYDPRSPSVLSVCTVHGGTAENIIPDSVSISGTTRYFDKDGRAFFEDRIGTMTDMVCRAHRTTGTLNYKYGYIPVVNDPAGVSFCSGAISAYLGSDSWEGNADMYLTSEDFSYFLDAVPGAMLLLGLGPDWPGLHTPAFDFNDRVLKAGTTALAGIALSYADAV